MNIQPIFFSQIRLVENPRHARTEWSQLETWQLAEDRITECLAKRVSRTMLAMHDIIDDSLLKSSGITVDNRLYMHTTHACNPVHCITWTRVQWQQHIQHPCSLLDLGVAFCTSPHTILDDCSFSMAARHGSHSLLGVLPIVLGALMAQLLQVPQQCQQLHPARQVRYHP